MYKVRNEQMNVSVEKLKRKAFSIRKMVLKMCIKAKTGHVTSSFSAIEVLVALYYGGVLRFSPRNPRRKMRDRFILSKAQASPALYAILADLGFYPVKELDGFTQKNGIFGVHLQNDVPGVEITAGSLGHGLGIAAGIALGAKMNKERYMVFALLGDGELYEGSVWESMMFASQHNLNNLVAIVDRNYLCTTDFTEHLIRLEPLESKWKSFGWDVMRISGHSFEEILAALSTVRSRKSVSPLVIIANTIKGKGVSFMSNIPLWHGIAPLGEDARRAMSELERDGR